MYCLPIYLSFPLSVFRLLLSTSLFVGLSFFLSLSVYLYVYLSVYMHHLSICGSVFLFVYLSVCQFILFSSLCLSIWLSICLSILICQFVCPRLYHMIRHGSRSSDDPVISHPSDEQSRSKLIRSLESGSRSGREDGGGWRRADSSPAANREQYNHRVAIGNVTCRSSQSKSITLTYVCGIRASRRLYLQGILMNSGISRREYNPGTIEGTDLGRQWKISRQNR